MMKRWWLMVIALIGWSLGFAQNPTPTIVDFEFSVMATERLRDLAYVQLKPEAWGKLRPAAADFDILPLRVNSQGRSELYRFTGPAPLRLVETTGSGATLAVSRVVATVAAPPSRGRSLFILYPSGEPDSWAVLAMDDEPSAFPARHLRLVNLAGEPMAVAVNGSTVALDVTPRAVAPRSINGNLKLGVAMARQGRAVPVFDQSLSVGDDERLLVVLLPPFRAGADVRTRVVRDSAAR